MTSRTRVGVLLLMAGSLAAAAARAENVARLSIEITAKGDLTAAVESVEDRDFDSAEGRPADVFGTPGAVATNDDGFVVFDHHFTDSAHAEALGTELRVESDTLVTDTGAAKDNMGPRVVVRHPRRFGLPLTVEVDVVRHGSIAKRQPTQAGRSFNFNFPIASDTGESCRLFVSFQATDTKYSSGLIYATWTAPGQQQPKELGTAPIKSGSARLQRKLARFPESARAGWYTVIRGDNAHIKRLRCAGLLEPAFGIELTGSAGQVTVKSVTNEGPAIREGDRVVSVNGERVRDVPTASGLLSQSPLFGAVKLEIRRGEESREVTLEGR